MLLPFLSRIWQRNGNTFINLLIWKQMFCKLYTRAAHKLSKLKPTASKIWELLTFIQLIQETRRLWDEQFNWSLYIAAFFRWRPFARRTCVITGCGPTVGLLGGKSFFKSLYRHYYQLRIMRLDSYGSKRSFVQFTTYFQFKFVKRHKNPASRSIFNRYHSF